MSTVLCVDDEPNILSALQRVLRGEVDRVITAGDGPQALQVLAQEPVDLVISDMRMPGMDGLQLLEKLHTQWPQTVRILLTGHADIDSAIGAVNRGAVFRYLQKPWQEAALRDTVHEGLERQALKRETERLQALTQRQNAELGALNAELEQRVEARTSELREAHERLQRQHLKSIRVFANLLELRGGTLAGHGRRVAEMARELARRLGLAEDAVTEVFVAALLHDLGLLGAGDRLLTTPLPRLTAEEQQRYREHPMAGEQSLIGLEDLQGVLPLIRHHHERWDGQGFPDRLAAEATPIGARILAVCDTFDELQNGHLVQPPLSREEARFMVQRGRGTQFDPAVLDAFIAMTEPRAAAGPVTRALRIEQLEGGMVLARDLFSGGGMLMLTAGHVLTPALIQRIREFELREKSQLVAHVQPIGVSA